jgi:NAD(P)-dependent dehydrogenase (short-subunit alcohol dehydrogenase family)
MNQEKVAIIGGSSGIGLAGARQLATAGYQVVISARSRERIDKALATIGAGCTGFMLDYSDRTSIEAFFDAAGSLEHLVLAGAGPSALGAFKELEPAVLESAFATKFWGYFHCLQAALPKLREDASVTMISGAAARTAIPGMAGLAAVNGAIERMGITLARELAPLRINVLSPGMVDTPVYDAMAPDQKRAMLQNAAAKLPLGRVGQPDAIAEALLFLIRERFITGAVLDVDGGARLAG